MAAAYVVFDRHNSRMGFADPVRPARGAVLPGATQRAVPLPTQPRTRAHLGMVLGYSGAMLVVLTLMLSYRQAVAPAGEAPQGPPAGEVAPQYGAL